MEKTVKLVVISAAGIAALYIGYLAIKSIQASQRPASQGGGTDWGRVIGGIGQGLGGSNWGNWFNGLGGGNGGNGDSGSGGDYGGSGDTGGYNGGESGGFGDGGDFSGEV